MCTFSNDLCESQAPGAEAPDPNKSLSNVAVESDIAVAKDEPEIIAEKVAACQSTIKEKKSTNTKIQCISKIYADVEGRAKKLKGGPRRFFFRVQKVVRCLPFLLQ